MDNVESSSSASSCKAKDFVTTDFPTEDFTTEDYTITDYATEDFTADYFITDDFRPTEFTTDFTTEEFRPTESTTDFTTELVNSASSLTSDVASGVEGVDVSHTGDTEYSVTSGVVLLAFFVALLSLVLVVVMVRHRANLRRRAAVHPAPGQANGHVSMRSGEEDSVENAL